MRILHTSDWHLGRTFGPVSLLDDQQAFVEWLVALVPEARVDLVVIAGDIYDRAVAPNDALVLFRETIKRLRASNTQIAVITGNHDSADRVATYDDLLDASGVYIRGGYTQIGEVLTLPFADGSLDVVMIPFLDPQAAPHDLDDESHTDTPDTETGDGETGDTETGDSDAFSRLLKRTHESVLKIAINAAMPKLTGARSIAVSHAYVSGATTTDSERKLTIGGAGTVNADLFAPFSYAALGHLHRPQAVGGSSHIRYSGTPLAYSFSEEHVKSVTIVDMAPDGSCTLEHVVVPVGRRVTTIEGRIDDLERDNPTAEQRECFVRAILTDRGVVLDAKKRLLPNYPNILEIELRPEGFVDGVVSTPGDAPKRSAFENGEAFWEAASGEQPNEEERALLASAVRHAQEALS